MRALSRPLLFPGSLLVLGSVLFLIGGSQHPKINASLGPVGSDQFFRAFAQHALMPGWEQFHALILIGPVLWALGIAGILAVSTRNAGVREALKMTMGIAATLWTVAFVLDGFNTTIFARAISTAANPETAAGLLFAFRINANTMAHLGLLAWTGMGLCFAAVSSGLMASVRAASWRFALGAIGVLIGLWPVLEIIRGDFLPGPFSSELWTATAIVTALWVAALGITLIATGPAENFPGA